MGCGVRPPQGLVIKVVVYEFLVLKISEPLFLQGDDNTYSTIIPKSWQVHAETLVPQGAYIWQNYWYAQTLNIRGVNPLEWRGVYRN